MSTRTLIREKFLSFYEERGHSRIKHSSLIPEGDSTTLFTGSGMQPLVPYLLGEKHPSGTRLVNVQPSLRVKDIEDIGDNRHTTFFEMLGNWSLGDYFKREQLAWIFDFLITEVKIDVRRLYVSVFRGDELFPPDVEAIQLWRSLFSGCGIDAEVVLQEKGREKVARISGYGTESNWWSRSGAPSHMPVGEPGGTDSELFYDLGEELGFHEGSPFRDLPCHINCDCGRFLEIGNSVFMEFKKVGEGRFEELSGKNIDFGGGLERILMAVEGTHDVFQTSAFRPLISVLEREVGVSYSGGTAPFDKTFRIIVDHLRAAVMIIGEKVVPSNKEHGYILRRLLRRAMRFAYKDNIPFSLLMEVGEEARKLLEDEYLPHLSSSLLRSVLDEEVRKFEKTMVKGFRQLHEYMGKGEVDGRKLFYLFETYGLPLELSLEELLDHEPNLRKEDLLEGYREELTRHQSLSKGDMKRFTGGLSDTSIECTRYHTATHLLLSALKRVVSLDIHQCGSNITGERLRLDFNHTGALTREQVAEIEKLVNGWITEPHDVEWSQMAKEEARRSGVEASFWERYPEMVKVCTIKSREGTVVSKEICGGPHVSCTTELSETGRFNITGQESLAAGVRRLKAVLR